MQFETEAASLGRVLRAVFEKDTRIKHDEGGESRPAHDDGKRHDLPAAINEAARALEGAIHRAVAGQADQEKQRSRDSNRNFYAAVAATIAGFLVFGATAYQAYLTQVAISAATRAADAASEQIALQRESTERADRAYVVIKGLRIERVDIPDLAPHLRWRLVVGLENPGRSPATVTAYALRLRRGRPPPTKDQCLDINDSALEKRERTTIVRPGGVESGSPVIHEQDLSILLHQVLHNQGGRDLVIQGAVFYRDIFNKERHTRFCSLFLGGLVDANNVLVPLPGETSLRPAFGQCAACNTWD